MCLQTYDEAARQAAVSRIYGGIHISIDNDDGLRLGKRIGETVAASLGWLSPERYRSKSGSQLLMGVMHFSLVVTSCCNLYNLVTTTCPQPGV